MGDRNEHREFKAFGNEALGWERIVEAVQREWGEPWEKIKNRHGDAGRELAMLIARRHGGLSLREIGEAVGGVKYPAVSDAIRRTSARLGKGESPLSRRLKAILHYLNL
jgi:chromosomal replication initiation ATPase DnaA